MKKKICRLVSMMICLFNISEAQFTQMGYYYQSPTFSLTATNTHIFSGTGGIIDITAPSAPVVTGTSPIGSFNTSVLQSGNITYYGGAMNPILSIVNTTSLSNPQLLSTVIYNSQNSNGLYGMVMEGDHLLIAGGPGGVYIVNVSDPLNPYKTDSIKFTTGQARDITAYNAIAYVAHTDGLKILSLTDPAHPSVINSISGNYMSITVDTVNKILYAGKNAGGFDAYDISTGTAPQHLYTINSQGSTTWDLKYHKGYLYEATNSTGMNVYRLTNDTATFRANFANTGNGQTFSVETNDSLIFVTGVSSGIAILAYDSTIITGIQDILSLDPYIYPNPSKGHFTILSEELIFETKVTDLAGSLVFESRTFSSELDLSFLPDGIYILTLFPERGNSPFIKKLILTE